MPLESDRHHVLFCRNEWESRPEARSLRREHLLIPVMDRQVHQELHRNVEFVPMLGRSTLALIARDFRPVRGDHLKTIEELLFEIEDKRMNPKVGRVERTIGELAIFSIEQQLPFIRDGIIKPLHERT